MSTDLAEQLALKNRQLELIMAIDRLRDGAADERELVAGIVSALADAVEAELCLLCVRDEDTARLQLRALTDRAGVYADPTAEERLRALAVRAADLPAGQVLDTTLDLGRARPLDVLAAPLRVPGESLGAALLLNADRDFTRGEQAVLEAGLSQVDSALQHAHTVRELERRQLELETIFRIDRLRDRTADFQQLLDAVLAEVSTTLDAETSFLLLYDRAGNELELRALTGDDLFGTDATAHEIRQLSVEAVRTAELIHRTYADNPLRAVVGVPLILRDKLIGVLGVANRRGRPAFTRTDLALLRGIASQMDTAIFENLATQRLRGAFGLCVGPQVMDRLLTISDRDLLSGERRQVTTLFSDIRGFTNMSEHIEAEVLQEVLNDHLSALTDLVLAYEGTLDKYIGDSVMCFFNAPENQPDHALRAVRLALEMQKAHRGIMARWAGRLPLPAIGIGISTGETMMGNFGSLRRLDYTAIGRDVNLAARLCAAADGDQTLISQATYALVQAHVVASPAQPLHLKGIGGDVQSWQLLGLK